MSGFAGSPDPDSAVYVISVAAELTAAGIGIEGVRRLLDLENQLTALRARNAELVAEVAALRDALAQRARPAGQPLSRQPALRPPTPSASLVVWRRGL